MYSIPCPLRSLIIASWRVLWSTNKEVPKSNDSHLHLQPLIFLTILPCHSIATHFTLLGSTLESRSSRTTVYMKNDSPRDRTRDLPNAKPQTTPLPLYRLWGKLADDNRPAQLFWSIQWNPQRNHPFSIHLHPCIISDISISIFKHPGSIPTDLVFSP